MTVDIDFELDTDDLARSVHLYRTESPGELGDAPLTVTWFCYPTWFRVDGDDLLGWEGQPLPVAILGFAMDLPSALAELDAAEQSECIAFGRPRTIYFTRSGRTIRIDLGYRPPVTADVTELFAATKRFAHRVAVTLQAALPEVFENELMRPWLTWALDPNRRDMAWR